MREPRSFGGWGGDRDPFGMGEPRSLGGGAGDRDPLGEPRSLGGPRSLGDGGNRDPLGVEGPWGLGGPRSLGSGGPEIPWGRGGPRSLGGGGPLRMGKWCVVGRGLTTGWGTIPSSTVTARMIGIRVGMGIDESHFELLFNCEQVLFVYVSTLIPPCLTDQRNFITVLIVTREPEQTTFLF